MNKQLNIIHYEPSLTHPDSNSKFGRKPLVLWGGTDIDPQWYDEPRHPQTQQSDIERDKKEWLSISKAIAEQRPIIGICRGAQLLCAFNGGKLDQHNPIHAASHSIITLSREGKMRTIIDRVSAGHHQVMLPAGNFIAYGIAPKEFDSTAEVIYWPNTNSLGIQPHPEWMDKKHPFITWLDQIMEECFGEKGMTKYVLIEEKGNGYDYSGK